MPPPVLTDENLSGPIVQALREGESELTLVRVQDVGLMGAEDPRVLEWAAAQDCILVTHDRKTIPHFAYQRIRRREKMAGVIVVEDQSAPGKVAAEIISLLRDNNAVYFRNRVFYISG